MSLRDWQANRWLVEHRTTPQEIADLLAVADRDLADCKVTGLSPDARLSIAYNGALQIATAALAACGYRATRDRHHHTVIQSLTFTIGAHAELVAEFDQFRKKRNISGYERAGSVSEREANTILALGQRLRRDVQKWLRAKHPELLKD